MLMISIKLPKPEIGRGNGEICVHSTRHCVCGLQTDVYHLDCGLFSSLSSFTGVTVPLFAVLEIEPKTSCSGRSKGSTTKLLLQASFCSLRPGLTKLPTIALNSVAQAGFDPMNLLCMPAK